MRSKAGLIVVLGRVFAIVSGCGSTSDSASVTGYDFARAWGSYGTGDGQFAFHTGSVAAGVAVDNLGNVHVADWGNNRIQKLVPAH